MLEDYKASEDGTISVEGGELVEVIDSTPSQWSFIRTVDRHPIEGWIPTEFIKPYNFSSSHNSN